MQQRPFAVAAAAPAGPPVLIAGDGWPGLPAAIALTDTCPASRTSCAGTWHFHLPQSCKPIAGTGSTEGAHMSVTSETATAAPAKPSRMLKAQQTDEAAWALINGEAAAREAKTRALRAMRMAQEAEQEAQQPEEKPAAKTARKTTTKIRRSRQK